MNITIPRKELKNLVQQIKRGLSSYYVQEKGNEVSFINIRDVSAGKISKDTVIKVNIKETGALEKSRIKANDVILTAKGSAFKAAVASKEDNNSVISSNLVAFTLTDTILPELVVAFLNSPTGQAELHSRSAGVAQKALNMKSIMEIKIPVPPMNKQKVLADYLSLSNEYEQLMRHEQELRHKIKNTIIENQMLG